jgi:LysR family nitrogen assimilation transcriptional regulator
MDLKHLRCFVRVAEFGSFVKAAEVLNVAQSTLSRQVRSLEIELKISLFHRNGRGVVLSPMGTRFLEQAHSVLRAADLSMLVLHGDERRLNGKVICGITPSVGQSMVREYARRFRDELPNATLSVSTHVSKSLYNQIRSSRIDFGIVHNATPSNAVEISSLGRQSLFVVGTQPLGNNKNKVDIRCLANIPLVMPKESHSIRKALELAAAEAEISLDIRFEVDFIDALFALVTDGFGYTISTQIATMALPSDTNLSVQKIMNPVLTSEVSLVTCRQRVMTPLQSHAAELARKTFRDVFQLV